MSISNAQRPAILDDLEKLRDMLVQRAGRLAQHIDEMSGQEEQHAELAKAAAAAAVACEAARQAAEKTP